MSGQKESTNNWMAIISTASYSYSTPCVPPNADVHDQIVLAAPLEWIWFSESQRDSLAACYDNTPSSSNPSHLHGEPRIEWAVNVQRPTLPWHLSHQPLANMSVGDPRRIATRSIHMMEFVGFIAGRIGDMTNRRPLTSAVYRSQTMRGRCARCSSWPA